MRLSAPLIIGGAVAIGLSGVFVWNRWDVSSRLQFHTLHPLIQSRARKLFQLAARRGITLRMTSALRDMNEQARLYAQGRTSPGQIVTYARPGQSYHNYGMAFDVVPMVQGRPDWNSPHWPLIGQLGEQADLNWGGSWRRPDRPHFEYPISLRELQAQYQAGTLQKLAKPGNAKALAGLALIGTAYIYAQRKNTGLNGTDEIVIPDKTVRAACGIAGTLIGYAAGRKNDKDTYPRTIVGGFIGQLAGDLIT